MSEILHGEKIVSLYRQEKQFANNSFVASDFTFPFVRCSGTVEETHIPEGLEQLSPN